MPRFDDTIHVTLAASRWLRIAGGAAHILALIVIGILALSQPWLAVIAVVIAIAAWRADQRFRLRVNGACTAFRWSADHRVQWQSRGYGLVSGQCIDARCWGASWVRLKWRVDDRRLARTLVIPADAVDAETHRRLRARCRVAPPTDQS